MKLLKRGRPSKKFSPELMQQAAQNVMDRAKEEAISELEKKEAHEANIQRLIAERAPVHWEEVAQKQEVELGVLRMENEELARICMNRYEEIERWKFVIKYLEKRIEDLAV